MWEYRWAECVVGESALLKELGDDGWEVIGMTVTGTHFERTYASLLLKRLRPALVDLTGADTTRSFSANGTVASHSSADGSG